MVGKRELSNGIAAGGTAEPRAGGSRFRGEPPFDQLPKRHGGASLSGEVSGGHGSPGRSGLGRPDTALWLARLAPAPERLPPGVQVTAADVSVRWYRVRLGAVPLTACLEVEIWHGEAWAHLALEQAGTDAPSLAELDWCRDVFLGDRKAIQILPRKREAFRAGLRTVHLYAQLEADSLPSNREQA
jgi:hypothetical protein